MPVLPQKNRYGKGEVMRSLKFRAWDTKKEVWTFATLGDLICGACEPDGDKPLSGAKQIWEPATGLKDKNGKEIYEGDILGGVWENGFISRCEKCKQFQYHCAGIGCMACSGDVHWYEIVEDDGKLEVIGNIHENPELLGGD